MDSPGPGHIAAQLAYRFEGCTNSLEIAAAVVSLWEEAGRELSPIIGPRGVVALRQRSLHLAGHIYPWLQGPDDDGTALEFEELQQLLARQEPVDAIECGGLLLQTFCEVLASLIGTSLTERLLRSVWARYLGPPSQRDIRT